MRRKLKQSPCWRDWLRVGGWTKLNPDSLKHEEFILCCVSAVKLKWQPKDRRAQSDIRRFPTACITENETAIFFPFALLKSRWPGNSEGQHSHITFLLPILVLFCSSKFSGLVCFVLILTWTTCPPVMGILIRRSRDRNVIKQLTNTRKYGKTCWREGGQSRSCTLTYDCTGCMWTSG